MLFNSYVFLIGYFPVSLIAMAVAGDPTNVRIVLILAVSLFFYGWWDWRFVPLLLGSIAVNYGLGGLLQRCVSDGRQHAAYVMLTVGIVLFVLFFPRLVAGPILRFGEIEPQLRN